MAPGTPPDMSFTVSPEKRAEMAALGGRHYRGPGLRPTKTQGSWHCPNCGAENQGRIEDGCVACPAGRPQPQQVPQESAPMPPALRPSPTLSPKAAPINKQELLDDIRRIVREELAFSMGGGFELTALDAFILRSLLDNIDIDAAAPEFGTTAADLQTLRDRLVAYELEHPTVTVDTAPGDPA